jgi:pyrroloquinoline quinone (PQQ) biosynthesis protein C
MDDITGEMVDEAFEVLRSHLDSDDSDAWDALDTIIGYLNQLENS